MTIEVTLPASKSYTQRAFVLAALSRGRSTIVGPCDCDDSRILAAALSALGVPLVWDADAVVIDGGGPLRPARALLELGNAGTAMRFLAGLSLIVEGELCLDGVDAMRRRSMPGLVAALRALGVEVHELGRPACPPLRLSGPGSGQRVVALDPTASSQQVSSLLMAGARLPQGLTVELTAPLPSRPYVDMTVAAISAFGGRCSWREDGCSLAVEPGLEATRFVIEADFSAAAMVMAGSWITGRAVDIAGLPAESCQGDAAFQTVVVPALSRPGPRTLDLGNAPDLVPPATAAALFAEGETRIIGIGHLRNKESDRLQVLETELARLGAGIESEADALSVRPGPLEGAGVTLDPHGDHRMAMAFGLVSLRVPGVKIADAGCVSKSFRDFWQVLELLR